MHSSTHFNIVLTVLHRVPFLYPKSLAYLITYSYAQVVLPLYGAASSAILVQALEPVIPLLVIDPVVALVYSNQMFHWL